MTSGDQGLKVVRLGVELDDWCGPRTVKVVHLGVELDDKWGPRTFKFPLGLRAR